MRYTKELQANVCADIKYGLTPQQCADKYNIPVAVVLKWTNLKTSVQRAKEIALRKYQVEVSEAEARLMNDLSDYFDSGLSDEAYTRASAKVSKSLYALSEEIIKKERDLNPHEDPPSDAEIISVIVDKWKDNKFLKHYQNYQISERSILNK